jgi:hypothetical protein
LYLGEWVMKFERMTAIRVAGQGSKILEMVGSWFAVVRSVDVKRHLAEV